MDKYLELLKNKEYERLANISFIFELSEIKYQDKYLIEYLLELGIHSKPMDEYLKYHSNFVHFYLKYNLIEPLFNCSLKVLFSRINGELIFDLILDKLNDSDKIKFYYNIRETSYNDFHYLEREIIDIYLRHGIILPVMFVTTKLDKIEDVLVDDDLIKEFENVFKDTDIKLLNFIVNEFKRNLLVNRERTINDIKKLINFKKENPTFKFTDNQNYSSGYYDRKKLILDTNANNHLMFNHELSHFLYQSTNENDNIIEKYESIRLKIDTEENYIKIKKLFNEINIKYQELLKKVEKKYLDSINEYYGSFDNYLKKVYLDMKDNTPELLAIWDVKNKNFSYPIITKNNLEKITATFINNEKNIFIRTNARQIFSPYLMLENMLDAILMGELFDDFSSCCLSGHGAFYYSKEESRSFDECLANYDAIKKSNNSNEILKILKDIAGYELINFLDNYLMVNREVSHGKR